MILLIPRCQSQTLISWCSQPLDQHQDGYRTDKTKRYLLRLLRQRDSLLEKYLWEIRLPTASNPLGFCHVKREGRNKSGYSCTAKDCRSFSSKAKGSTAKAFCLHLHLLFASLEQFSPAEQAGPSSSSSSSSSASQSEPVVSFDSEDVEDSLQRKSTILLAYKTRSLPYQFPRHLLHSIMARDLCTLFGVEGSWPSLFQPSVDNCGLCESPLGRPINHPGQQSNSAYLVTELNPFKKVDVKVRVCQRRQCMAIHQPFPADIGKVIELFSRIIYLWQICLIVILHLLGLILLCVWHPFTVPRLCTESPSIFLR